MFQQFFRNLLYSEDPPNKVISKETKDFSTRGVKAREDGLVLYEPPIDVPKGSKAKFEIVLHRPTTETLNQIFSLYRTPNLEDAEVKFIMMKDKIPIFIEINREMCNLHGLQKISDTLSEHPSWTMAHLAAHFSLYDSFSDPKINCFLNSTDTETGMSPLQVAIMTQNQKMVQVLVAANCSLEHLDYNANSVFHFAASTTKEIIGILVKDASPRLLNSRNKNGNTPLHMACLADKSECVTALLLAGADVNMTATGGEHQEAAIEPSYIGNYLQSNPNTLHLGDIKNGGTPLHWAKSRLVIEALIERNCHINAVNFELKTALHVMVEKNNLDCVVALLSRQANADLGDKDGNRPIHLAVKRGKLPIIQALIVFGVDLNILNNAGHTARHLISEKQAPKLLYYLTAVGATRCLSGVHGCSDGCKYDGTFQGIPPPPVLGSTNRDMLNLILSVSSMEVATEKHNGGKFPKHGRLLCLDGGGIRGLVLVQMLLELEDTIGRPIVHCFDWVAGTSTGGILALALACGKTMKECQCLYFSLKEQAFVGMRPYPSDILESILKDTFGTETVMADIKHPKVMVTGALVDRRPIELHLFRNYLSPSSILEMRQDGPFEQPPPPERQFIWEVGRATGAAPTYFKGFGRFLDGGLIANNPTLDALTEIHEHTLALRAKGRAEEAAPVTVVVSLGTGLEPTSEIKMAEADTFWDNAKMIMGMFSLGNLLIDQATASHGRVVDRARAWCSSLGVPYFRFCPQLSEDVNLDEKSNEKLCRMLWETKAYMYEHTNVMKELADILNKG